MLVDLTASDPGAQASRLRPYLPRLELQWLVEDPSLTVRELDGTLVFVDISGFTKMSERLARHGRVGAEEVTDVLGAVFARLLAVAYANGGGLIKFGGDALLLWFAGPEHAVRGTRAAHGMRATLRSIGRIDTTAGKVTLRMSIGVNTGRFHLFLVGDSHRELLVTGPAASGTVLMEAAASAGEILLAPTTFQHLPEKVLGMTKGPGRLLRSEPPGLSPDTAEEDVPLDGLDLLPYIPVALRDSALSGAQPEHRTATVAFVHFDGTDALIEGEGPEAAAIALDELVRDVQRAVDEQGVCFLGSDVDADGGKLILTAGAPRALGDDEERMLLALRRIVQGERRISVRIGANLGAVFSGDVGPVYRRTYTVMGDTVNLAARLMAKAPPGEIYATAAVLERSRTRFERAELEPFLVKGKARPVQAWSVGPALSGRLRAGGVVSYPLVGRKEEAGQLLEALDAARRGAGRLIELVGEPGIGKTRLIEHLRQRAAGFRIEHATAEAYTSSTPYAVWRELLREILGVTWEAEEDVVVEGLRRAVEEVAPDLTPWMTLLGNVLDVSIPASPEVELLAPEFLRPKTHEVVAGFLHALLREPTLLVIEDVHLMDAASADLLRALTGTLPGEPWLVLVTRRDTDTGSVSAQETGAETLSLPPLTRDEAFALAKVASEAQPLLPSQLDVVVERSAGNPQLLIDLVVAIRAGSMLPDSVEAAAMVTIDMLAPEDRSLVRRASVLGVSFHPRFVADMLDEGERPPDERTWDRLSGLFEDEGEGYVRFRRAIVRDAAYAGLPFRTRRRLHLLAGERLERELFPAVDEASPILSLHFFMAEDFGRAWNYARTAGDRAAALYANEEAARLYQRAIDAGHQAGATSRDMLTIKEAQGDVLRRGARWDEAARAYADARRLCADDPMSQARLLYKRGWLDEDAGRFGSALRWLGRGRGILLAAEPSPEGRRLAARFSARYANVQRQQGRMVRASRSARRAIEEAEASGARDALAEALNTLGTTLAWLGRAEAEEHLLRAARVFVEIGDRLGQAIVEGNLGVHAYFRGRWDQAVGYYERARELFASVGDPVRAAAMGMNVAEVLVDQGKPEEADLMLIDVARVFRASGDRFTLALCEAFRGRAALRLGRLTDAFALLASAREGFEGLGAHSDALEVDARTTEAMLFAAEPERALQAATELLARLRRDEGAGHLTPILERARGYALVQLGEPGAAREAFGSGLAAARDKDAEYEVALALQASIRLASLRGDEPPVGAAEECSSILRGLGIVAVPAPPLSVRASVSPRDGA